MLLVCLQHSVHSIAMSIRACALSTTHHSSLSCVLHRRATSIVSATAVSSRQKSINPLTCGQYLALTILTCSVCVLHVCCFLSQLLARLVGSRGMMLLAKLQCRWVGSILMFSPRPNKHGRSDIK